MTAHDTPNTDVDGAAAADQPALAPGVSFAPLVDDPASLRPARNRSRVIAFLVDLGAALAVGLTAAVVVGAVAAVIAWPINRETVEVKTVALQVGIAVLVAVGYGCYLWNLSVQGAIGHSLGKRVNRIALVYRDDATPVGPWISVGRHLLNLLLILVGVAVAVVVAKILNLGGEHTPTWVLGVGAGLGAVAALPFWRRTGQNLSDRAIGSMVISLPSDDDSADEQPGVDEQPGAAEEPGPAEAAGAPSEGAVQGTQGEATDQAEADRFTSPA